MATTTNTYTATAGQTDFAITFEYIEQNDVFVTVNEVANTAWTFLNATTIRFDAGLAAGDVVLIYRRTDEDLLEARFLPGSAIRAKDLNANDEQLLFLIQENQSSIKAITGGGELPPPDPGDSVSLNDLSDVTITSPANGNILEFDGTNWGNTTWHQGDWTEEDTTQPGFIQNKPDAFGTTYLGTRNCVDNGPTDDEPVGGFYVNTAGGTPDAGWGFPQGTQLGINDRVIKLDDGTWSIFGVGNNVVAQDTPPESALGGDLWWDSGTTTALYFYYVDNDGGQWVPCTPSGGVVGSDEIANGSVTPEKLSTGGPSWDTTGNLTVAADSDNFAKLEPAGVIKLEANNVAMSSASALQVKFDDTQNVSIDYDGSALFGGTVTTTVGQLADPGGYSFIKGVFNSSTGTVDSYSINADGSAEFAGSVTINDPANSSGHFFGAGGGAEHTVASGTVGTTPVLSVIKGAGNSTFQVTADGIVSAPNACTAWVNFAGANGALRGSFNVNGPVTRLNTGRYQIVFATEMDNADYCAQVSSNQLTTIIDDITTTSVNISVFDSGGSRVDTNIICCTVYGGKD